MQSLSTHGCCTGMGSASASRDRPGKLLRNQSHRQRGHEGTEISSQQQDPVLARSRPRGKAPWASKDFGKTQKHLVKKFPQQYQTRALLCKAGQPELWEYYWDIKRP